MWSGLRLRRGHACQAKARNNGQGHQKFGYLAHEMSLLETGLHLRSFSHLK
ncbi:hypothetical protein APS_0134 [Acetobacter pasteurianus subsp. pasteurianus LMG 1262 = NBRC 106471]|nr:hypothetical protein APS_0134 [Acetobacter pasteurianus subsp. pasteurianus LMG 1262 = NBRC 106471]